MHNSQAANSTRDHPVSQQTARAICGGGQRDKLEETKDLEDPQLWASPFVIAAATHLIDEYVDNVKENELVKIRIALVEQAIGSYDEGVQLYEASVDRFTDAHWVGKISRVLVGLSVAFDVAQGATTRLERDKGMLLDPATRNGRAAAQGIAVAIGGIGGSAVGMWAGAAICSALSLGSGTLPCIGIALASTASVGWLGATGANELANVTFDIVDSWAVEPQDGR